MGMMCTRMGCLVEASALPIISNSRVRVRTKRSARCKRTLPVALVFVGDAAIISRDSPVKPVRAVLQVYTMAFRRALNVLLQAAFPSSWSLAANHSSLSPTGERTTANCPPTRHAHPTNGHSREKSPDHLQGNRQSFQHFCRR